MRGLPGTKRGQLNRAILRNYEVQAIPFLSPPFLLGSDVHWGSRNGMVTSWRVEQAVPRLRLNSRSRNRALAPEVLAAFAHDVSGLSRSFRIVEQAETGLLHSILRACMVKSALRRPRGREAAEKRFEDFLIGALEFGAGCAALGLLHGLAQDREHAKGVHVAVDRLLHQPFNRGFHFGHRLRGSILDHLHRLPERVLQGRRQIHGALGASARVSRLSFFELRVLRWPAVSDSTLVCHLLPSLLLTFAVSSLSIFLAIPGRKQSQTPSVVLT